MESDPAEGLAWVRESYANLYSDTPRRHAWFDHATACIHREVTSLLSAQPARRQILDAGCGQMRYGVTGHEFVRMDLAAEAVRGDPGGVVGDVQKLPFRDESFDVVICVGSVLNYLRLRTAVAELARVARPGGTLLLEYERSTSWTNVFTCAFGKDEAEIEAEYLDGAHRLTLYSDAHLDRTLRAAGVEIAARQTFHNVTGVAYLLTRNLRLSAEILARLDRRPIAGLAGRLGANGLVRAVKR